MRISTIATTVLCSSVLFAHAAPAVQPFENSQWPAPKGYTGPTFKISHDYPQSASAPAMPWRTAINNEQISPANALAYVEALKAAVGDDMRVMLQDYQNWDAGKRGWYNEPWMGKTSNTARGGRFREPLRGMYVGSSVFPKELFKASGLTKDFTTYVLVYYDKTAAVTLNNIWGATAMAPKVTPATTQFAEGSIIIKAAFVTVDPAAWPAMKGTLAWPSYIETNASKPGTATKPSLTPTYLMQFDIIVKDSVSAPKTGWVFSTLVYDASVPGPEGDIWKKMVVLGAQWGNDPQAKDPLVLKPTLLENWNNMNAPAYGRATLGWGERLSGPNDGAMNDIGYARPGSLQPTLVKNAKDSSCMSCHSSAQWDTRNQQLGMKSWLLPALGPFPPPPPPGCDAKQPALPCNKYQGSPPPGSEAWMKWFQNRQGNVAMDPSDGNVAGDFDMVLTFKTLPAWFSETQHKSHALLNYDKRGQALSKPATAPK